MLRQTVDRRRFAEKLCELCYAGDVQAMRLLLSYTDGLPIGHAEGQSLEGIQIKVIYVQQNNQLEFTGTASSASQSGSGSETIQCSVSRASLGEDDARDGSIDSRSAGG